MTKIPIPVLWDHHALGAARLPPPGHSLHSQLTGKSEGAAGSKATTIPCTIWCATTGSPGSSACSAASRLKAPFKPRSRACALGGTGSCSHRKRGKPVGAARGRAPQLRRVSLSHLSVSRPQFLADKGRRGPRPALRWKVKKRAGCIWIEVLQLWAAGSGLTLLKPSGCFPLKGSNPMQGGAEGLGGLGKARPLSDMQCSAESFPERISEHSHPEPSLWPCMNNVREQVGGWGPKPGDGSLQRSDFYAHDLWDRIELELTLSGTDYMLTLRLSYRHNPHHSEKYMLCCSWQELSQAHILPCPLGYWVHSPARTKYREKSNL